MYHVEEISAPPGSCAFPGGINNSGSVAGGIHHLPRPDYPAIWVEDVLARTFPDRVNAGLCAINEAGVAVGTSGYSTVIRLDETGLAALPVATSATATGINDAGRICGYGIIEGAWVGFCCDSAGGTVELMGLPGFDHSLVGAINNAGEVAGTSYHGQDVIGTAFFHSGGAVREIGPALFVSGMNDAGLVIGEQVMGIYDFVPVMCDARNPEATWSSIPTPVGYAFARPYAVNNLGHIIGGSYYWIGDYKYEHAFLYRDGVSIDLNHVIDGSGWELHYATDINDVGQICGMGYHHGVQTGFLLTPWIGSLKPDILETHIWPLVLPDGPPPPREDPRLEEDLLSVIRHVSAPIADISVRDRVTAALTENARARLRGPSSPHEWRHFQGPPAAAPPRWRAAHSLRAGSPPWALPNRGVERDVEES